MTYFVLEKIPDETISVIYIDADHSYEGVKKDIEAWFPKVVPEGIVAFHDYETFSPTYGVKRAVQEFCNKHNYQIISIPENSIDDAGAYFIKY